MLAHKEGALYENGTVIWYADLPKKPYNLNDKEVEKLSDELKKIGLL